MFTMDIFTKTGHPKLEQFKKIKVVEDLKKGKVQIYKLGAYIGAGWQKKNLIDKGYEVDMAPNLQQCLQKLKQGRFDLLFDVGPVVLYQLKKLGLQKDIVRLPNSISALPFHLLIGKKSNHIKILPKFNETMKKMQKEGVLEKIYDKYR